MRKGPLAQKHAKRPEVPLFSSTCLFLVAVNAEDEDDKYQEPNEAVHITKLISLGCMSQDKRRNWRRLFLQQRSNYKDLEERHQRTLEDYVHLETEHKMNGGSVAGKPVIPEYMGFDEVDRMEGRPVYERDGYYMYQAEAWNGQKWVIITPHQQVEVEVSDQLQLIHVLRALGCDITIERYIKGELAPTGML